MNNSMLNDLGLAPLSQEEQVLTNGGTSWIEVGGIIAGAVVAFLEEAGKGIAEANANLPTYAQGMK